MRVPTRIVNFAMSASKKAFSALPPLLAVNLPASCPPRVMAADPVTVPLRFASVIREPSERGMFVINVTEMVFIKRGYGVLLPVESRELLDALPACSYVVLVFVL